MGIGNIPARKRGFGYDPVTRSLGVYTDGALTASFPPTPGRTYFVNNITGASTNDGLSWANAMDQVSTAITASVAYQATQTSGNNVRNSIIIQGTTTKYTPISTMPLYTNVIGLGGDPRGNAFGNVRIGDTTDAADGAAGDEAGNYFYNIQFNGGGSYWAVDLGVTFSSTWDNCTFGTASDNSASAGGLRVLTAGSGSTFVNCDNIAHNGWPAFGMQICAAGGTLVFNDCRIENCLWFGSTTGLYNKAYLCGGTIVTGCTLRGGGYGMNDESTNNTAVAGILVTNNFAIGTTSGITLDNNGTLRAMGNFLSNNGTGATYVDCTTP